MHLVCYCKILAVLKTGSLDLKSSLERIFRSYPSLSLVDPSLKIIYLTQSGAVLPTFRTSFAKTSRQFSFLICSEMGNENMISYRPWGNSRDSVKRLVNYVRVEVSRKMDTTTNHKF